MVDGYKFSRDSGRGTTALLDATFEVALTGIDVTTGGSSLVATTGVRWVKRQALDALTDKIVSDARDSLAGGIRDYVQTQGLDYESLRTKSPNEIKATLDQVAVFKGMKDKLAGDTAGQEILDKTAIDLVVNTSKSTLDQVAQTQQEVTRAQAEVTDLAHSLSRYIGQTKSRLDDLSSSLDDANTAVAAANQSIQTLEKETAQNTEKLQMIGGFMFGHATARERLMMLNSGFMKDGLSNTEFKPLKSATEADAKREKLVADMNNVVNQFNKVGKIAQDLNIDIPGLSEGLTIANAATTVISDVMSGDFLGAIGGVTGLFGSRPDPLAEFRRQLFNYLDEQFKQVNGKLDELIAGQQKLMDGLVQLSKQMAAYDKALHDRLDRIEFKLDNIEATSRQTLYWPLGTCETTKTNIARTIQSASLGPLDLTRFEQAKLIPGSVSFSSQVLYCITYLETLYGLAFNPTSFGFDPLALRYSHQTPNGSYAVKPESDADVNQYETQMQAFLNRQYKPSFEFFDAARRNPNPIRHRYSPC